MDAGNTIGIRTAISDEGINVVRIHFTADPGKNPSTPEGAAWLQRELQGYKGLQDPRWRKEMEIDFSAHGGQLLFPYLTLHEQNIYMPISPPNHENCNLVAGLDYGTRNPSAFEVLAVGRYRDKKVDIFYEYYEPPKKRTETDEAFKARKGYKKLSKAIKDCPYFPYLGAIYADPSMWNKTQETRDGLKSVADLFAEEGIVLTQGQRGGDFACYERLDDDYWADPAAPKLRISRACPWLWHELTGLRWEDYSEAVQVSKNLKETIADKDNHGWDAIKYCLMSMPMSARKKTTLLDTASMVQAYVTGKSKVLPWQVKAKRPGTEGRYVDFGDTGDR